MSQRLRVFGNIEALGKLIADEAELGTPLAPQYGGTGLTSVPLVSLIAAADAAAARVILELGSLALQDADDVELTGGSIDGVTIGATTAAAGAFTTLSSDSLDVDGTAAFAGLATFADNVEVAGELEVQGVANFGEDVVINGNLTVNGTETILNVTTLDVEDKNITVNKGGTLGGSVASGLFIEADSVGDAGYMRVSATDEAILEFKAPGTTYSLIVDGPSAGRNILINQDLSSTANVTFNNINADGNVIVDGGLIVNGSSDFNDAVNVNSTSVFGGVATFDGQAEFNGTVAFSNAVSFDTSFNITLINAAEGLLSLDNNGVLQYGSSVDLDSQVTGILPVANGGTGVDDLPQNRVLLGNGTAGILTNANLVYDNDVLVVGGAGQVDGTSVLQVNGSIRIGQTSDSADVAGEGSIRYNSGQLLLSDGTDWIAVRADNAFVNGGNDFSGNPAVFGTLNAGETVEFTFEGAGTPLMRMSATQMEWISGAYKSVYGVNQTSLAVNGSNPTTINILTIFPFSSYYVKQTTVAYSLDSSANGSQAAYFERVYRISSPGFDQSPVVTEVYHVDSDDSGNLDLAYTTPNDTQVVFQVVGDADNDYIWNQFYEVMLLFTAGAELVQTGSTNTSISFSYQSSATTDLSLFRDGNFVTTLLPNYQSSSGTYTDTGLNPDTSYTYELRNGSTVNSRLLFTMTVSTQA